MKAVQPKHVVVLGGGPAGLATAHELSMRGATTTVLERNDYVGGLCRTVSHDGYRFDLGGHRWFTKNEDLNCWFRRLMSGEIVEVDRISRVYHDGKFFSYPIRFADVIRNSGPVTIVHAGLSFLWATVKNAITTKPPRNIKEAFTAQFGSKLYQMFFRRYTEKVWGKPCEELSADWVSQRSQGLSIWSMVREALVGEKEQSTSLIEEFMYPRDGYMRIPERMAEDVRASGNNVTLGATVSKIRYRGPYELDIHYQQDDRETVIRADHIVSTIPLSLLAQMIEPSCDEAVMHAARGLEFRSLITITLMIKKQQVSRDTWLYVQDQSILFGRIHEPKNWSPALVPDDAHTSLVLECFCTRDDEIWMQTDAEIAQRCIEDLTHKLGFIEPADVTDWVAIRTHHAYPVYDLAYAEKIATIRGFLDAMPGMHIAGRGGTFRYNNADHSIEMGLLLAREILGYEVDHMAVNTEAAYQEIVTGAEPERSSFQDVSAQA